MNQNGVVVLTFLSVAISLFILYYYIQSVRNKEQFVANIKTALCTNVLQHNIWLRRKSLQPRAIAFDNEKWPIMAPKFKDPKVLGSISNTSDVLFVTDPLDAMLYFKDKKRVTQGPKGYFFALYDPVNALHVDCSFNLQNKRVGFLDRSDVHFIKAIVQGYRMKSPVEIRQIPMKQWDNLENALKYFDVIITYIIPNSDMHRILQMQNIGVMGFKNLDIDRIRLFYPFVKMDSVKITDALNNVPGSALKIAHDNNSTELPYMNMSVMLLKGRYTEKFQGNFSIELSEDAIDPSYRCFGDLNIEQKALCNSPNDVIGMPKRRQTFWDRPCVRDEDCPFFNANKNYPNKRGGCLKGGVCEMPIGVKRIAYRMYENKGQYAPFCYGCESPTDPNCCAKQYIPDYAFPNDTQQRLNAGRKETIINMN